MTGTQVALGIAAALVLGAAATWALFHGATRLAAAGEPEPDAGEPDADVYPEDFADWDDWEVEDWRGPRDEDDWHRG